VLRWGKGFSVCLIAVLLASVFVCLHVPLVEAASVFSDGFESGNGSAWSTVSGSPSFTSEAHCGSYGMRCSSSNNGYVRETFTGESDCFARFYIKFSSSVGDFAMLALLSNSGNNGVSAGLFNGQLFLKNEVTFAYYWGPSVTTGQWYCVEFERTTGSGSAVARMWLDGVKVIEQTGLTFSGDSNRFELGSISSLSSTVVDFDCVVVADSQVGVESEAPASPETVSVSLNNPENEYTLTGWTQNFTYTPVLVGASSFQNASLYIDGSRVAGNASALVNNTVNGISHTFSSNGTYTWTVQVCNSTHGVFPVANYSVNVAVYTAPNYYYINATVGGHGSISPSGLVEVEEGANQDFTISPDIGYHVSDVQVDSVSVGAVDSYNFSSVTANHTISASFAINNYTITASADGNSSITPSGVVVVDYGGNQEFTFNAAEGYHVSLVLVDDVEVSLVSPYVFEAVAGNHTIAVFSEVDGVEPSPSPTVTPTASSVVVGEDVEGLAVLGLVFGLVAFSVAAVTFTRKKAK
jgi:hypothetical protein